MSKGINKVILIGNLGSDPEVRYMPSGGPVATLRVATSETWKDKQTGQAQERTEWHRVVIFNRLAEIAGQYLKKGSKIYIEGSLRTQKWQDKTTGQDRYTTEIVCSSMQMLDTRGQQTGSQPDAFGPPPDFYAHESAAHTGGSSSNHHAAPAASAIDNAMLEDDVPF